MRRSFPQWPALLSILLCAAMFVLPGWPSAVRAELGDLKRVEWDLGAGLGAFEYRLYPGSADTDSFVLPFPYFTYVSDILEIDRGIKGLLYDSEYLVLDISADFALPVDSDDSAARRGMPDLDAVLQLGPSLEFLLGDRDGRLDTRFELPLRLALSTDFASYDQLGWLLEPRLSVEYRRDARVGFSGKLTAGVQLATRDYYSYYYDVTPATATATRPVYNSDAGRGGLFFRLRGSYRFDDWVLWSYLRYSRLDSAVFVDSPLVETESYYFIGFGFAWIFASSL